MGKPLGSYAPEDSDAKRLRATFAECLFGDEAQECVLSDKSGTKYRFRFEKVLHTSNQLLRPDDEVVVLAIVSEEPPGVDLTGRERQIIRMICQDLSSAEIASHLKISVSTVETHRQNIRRKLGVRGTAGVVLYALRHNLTD
jgi:DNA-binding CsgD family transcriptional regulator